MNQVARSSGFTLIEILLVLTIVGLFSGAVLLSVPNNHARALQNEVQEFQSLLVQTSIAAVRNSEHYGIGLMPGRWQLYQFDEPNAARGRWVPVAWEDLGIVHASYNWADSTHAELDLGQTNLPRSRSRQSTAQPELIVYANGETTDFSLQLVSTQDKGLSYRLQSDGLNFSMLEE